MARLFVDETPDALEVTSTVYHTPPFAWVGWYYHDEATDMAILSVGRLDSSQDHMLYVNYSGPTVSMISRTSSFGVANSGANGTLNTWEHACGIVAAADNRRAYIHGANEGTDNTSKAPSNLTGTGIGVEYQSSRSRYFSGSLAEIAAYDLSGYPGATDSLKADAFRDTVLPALAAGFSPLCYPLGLRNYIPLVRDADKDIVGGLSFTPVGSPGVSAHPGIIYPARPQIVTAVAAAPPAGIPILRRRREAC